VFASARRHHDLGAWYAMPGAPAPVTRSHSRTVAMRSGRIEIESIDSEKL
jgi:hypothetical protein